MASLLSRIFCHSLENHTDTITMHVLVIMVQPTGKKSESVQTNYQKHSRAQLARVHGTLQLKP